LYVVVVVVIVLLAAVVAVAVVVVEGGCGLVGGCGGGSGCGFGDSSMHALSLQSIDTRFSDPGLKVRHLRKPGLN